MEKPAAPGELFGTGRILASFAFLELDREDIAGLLPRGLELTPRPQGAADRHLLVLMFGEHADVHPVYKGKDLPGVTASSYTEFILAVPYVRETATGKGPYLHFLRLYLDDLRAVLAGWYYGYPKLLAHMEPGQTRYRVAEKFTGEPIVSAAFQQIEHWDQAAFHRNLAALEEVYSQPIISKRGAKFSCSRFFWNFDSADSWPIRLRFQIHKSFLAGLRPVKKEALGLDQDVLGSFRTTTRWTLTPPESCPK